MTIADIFSKLTHDRRRCASRPSTAAGSGRATPPYTLRLVNERGLRYLATAPGDLGMARAYVAGDLRPRRCASRRPVRSAAADGIAGAADDPPPPSSPRSSAGAGLAPTGPAGASGRRSTCRAGGGSPRGCGTRKLRDSEAIHHHYDVSNEFYEMVLGPSMAYTCAVFPKPDATLEEAQDGEVRPRLPQARPRARACVCSTSGAAGAGWSGTPSRTTASPRSASRCRSEQAKWGAARDPARGRLDTRRRPARATTATLLALTTTRSARSA